MKKSLQATKSLLGVTLLEIMLVLAIASMVIVMSIRYYQSASTNQKINSALNTITGIVAAGESYLAAVGTLSAISDSVLQPYLPGTTMPNSPWGGPAAISSPGASKYTITMSSPQNSCDLLKPLVNQNAKLVANCTGTNITVVVTE